MEINQRIRHLLKKIGLTNSEAKLFVVANNNPGLSIKKLQKKSKLSKTSIYRAFENLKSKGFIDSSDKKWRKNVKAVSLNTLVSKLGKERRKIGKIETELKKIHNLTRLTQDTQFNIPIEILTKQEEITEYACKLVHKPWEKLLAYGSAERLIDIIGEYGEDYFVKKRYKQGKEVDAIVTENGDYIKYLMPTNSKELRRIKLHIDPKQSDYCMYIYDNEMSLWNCDKKLGNRVTIIKNAHLADMNRNMFTSLWKTI